MTVRTALILGRKWRETYSHTVDPGLPWNRMLDISTMATKTRSVCVSPCHLLLLFWGCFTPMLGTYQWMEQVTLFPLSWGPYLLSTEEGHWGGTPAAHQEVASNFSLCGSTNWLVSDSTEANQQYLGQGDTRHCTLSLGGNWTAWACSEEHSPTGDSSAHR